ncbi:hypothetical protein DL93DRAFT_696710 [Clavulina sp. PMI_390]|nr:hypothetical protein DL93DRAFT_696710 [Clavulina sp. PMI_390]
MNTILPPGVTTIIDTHPIETMMTASRSTRPITHTRRAGLTSLKRNLHTSNLHPIRLISHLPPPLLNHFTLLHHHLQHLALLPSCQPTNHGINYTIDLLNHPSFSLVCLPLLDACLIHTWTHLTHFHLYYYLTLVANMWTSQPICNGCLSCC